MNTIKSLAIGLVLIGPGCVRAADFPMALALEAAQEALSSCKSSGYDVTVTVLDKDMATRIVLRGDGAKDFTVQVAFRKAYTVLKTGMSSGEFGKTVPPQTVAPGSLPGPVNGDPNLITWAGGLAVTAGHSTVGAMSVSGAPGGDKDEACVRAGLAKIASRLK
jgi:uncharacterized protein GlcG (DUF336 family)